MNIKIKTEKLELLAELYDNSTAKKISEILPINGRVNTWGNEIYFEIPLHLELDGSAKDVVEKGELGFWPQSDCFCIFFGRTPASKGNEIRAASKVNVFGRIKADPEILKQVKGGENIIIENA